MELMRAERERIARLESEVASRMAARSAPRTKHSAVSRSTPEKFSRPLRAPNPNIEIEMDSRHYSGLKPAFTARTHLDKVVLREYIRRNQPVLDTSNSLFLTQTG